MKSNVETMEKNKVKLTITFDPQEFEKGVQQAYKKTVKRYNIPGFRKGKAPRFMIEQYYGSGVFYQDAFDIIFPDAYDSAIKEHELQPVASPEIDIDAIGKEEGLVAVCTVVVKPEVELGEYLGLEVTRKIREVDDAQIDHEIGHEREKVARFVEVTDRPAEMGDDVNIDYEGFLDGVPFEGGAAEHADLTLGSGRFIPGFEEKIVGMNIGEQRDIDITFPDPYQSEELAGKDVVFKIALHSITKKELPELDDEFAQDVSEFDTLDEYKKSIREKLEEQAKQTADNMVENALVLKAADNATIDIPNEMVERQIDYQIRELEFRLMMSGMNLGQYMDYAGISQAQLRQDQYKRAFDQVRIQLTLEAIAKREELKVSDEDWAKEFEKAAEEQGKTWQELKEAEKPEQLDDREDRILVQKTLDILKENAEITDEYMNAEDYEKDAAAEEISEAAEEESEGSEDSEE